MDDAMQELPGFRRSLDWAPLPPHQGDERGDDMDPCLYPTALRLDELEFKGPATTLRELGMMAFMDTVTDKPDWREKVTNPTITDNWKQEAIASAAQGFFSQQMADNAIEELKHKAEDYKELGGVVLAYDPGVVKSDIAFSPQLKAALQEAVRPLEEVPENRKDWHPGSNEQVLDLVHPSLFPLVYGRTRMLTDRRVNFEDPVMDTGLGVLLEDRPNDVQVWELGTNALSRAFQWLPCDVEFDENGKTRITSYINNLHPGPHRPLYTCIEQIIEAAVPLWNVTLSSWPPHPNRIPYTEIKSHEVDESLVPQDPAPGEAQHYFWERQWRIEQQVRGDALIQPEPTPENVRGSIRPTENLRKQFGGTGLQVIVKLANIHLTPEKPTYEGGTWHVEGQLNEHIVSTALYYYDSHNITESRLAFRLSLNDDQFDEFGYEQGHHEFLPKIFGLENYQSAVQNIGSVGCYEGRLITFPNILQHQVQPFELQDKTKEGHRKILALFLVDPHMKIIGTGNVPPQQREWWAERLWNRGLPDARLPREVFEGIVAGIGAGAYERKRVVRADGGPVDIGSGLCVPSGTLVETTGGVDGVWVPGGGKVADTVSVEGQSVERDPTYEEEKKGFKHIFPIGLDEAKVLRLRLMKERSQMQSDHGWQFQRAEYSLCEH